MSGYTKLIPFAPGAVFGDIGWAINKVAVGIQDGKKDVVDILSCVAHLAPFIAGPGNANTAVGGHVYSRIKVPNTFCSPGILG